ncbi:phage tail protein [Acinetobacter sp. YH01024]|uniref:phage tail protein n=1 Tax=Acinetobacter sp. YH01024 TaxID=2601037 RepID=UPI0015D391D4|nr:phage tail protein [Acinetobacter sp. YH01024]
MSSGKKQTVGYKYSVGFHAVLAHAGAYLRRIWVEDKEAWYGGVGNESSRISKPYLFGGDDSGGGVAGNFNYYIGTPDQKPDPYLESVLGKGNVPAYRGVSSFVWKQGYIGNQNYMKDWKYRISHVGGINSNITNVPSNFVFAFDCSKSLSMQDFVRLKNTLSSIVNTLVFFKETYYNCVLNVRIIAFDATVTYKDFIDFQVSDAGEFGDFIAYKDQVSGNSFSEMMITGYSFFSKNAEATRNTFVIIADGKDVRASHTATAQSHFNAVKHFCLYTQFIASANNADLPHHIALSSLDNTPEDNWVREDVKLGGGLLCPWIWTDDGSTLINEEAWFGIRTGEPDMNPADMLWLCITNAQWGLGQPESMLDKDSFLEAWRVLKIEDMYMSIVFDDEGQIQNIINLICEHIDASCFVDKKTNKWTLKLIRDDYEAESLVVLDESNVRSISDYEIRTAAEQVNQVTVTYWNKETGKNATSTAQDPARIAQNGLVNKPVEYDGFTNAATAYRAAERDLHALSSPLKLVTLNEVHPDFGRKLSVGDAFTWNWSAHGVTGAVMRVKSIDYGDAHDLSVKIEAIEDVFSTPMNSVAPYVPPVENPAIQPPQDNPTVRVIELPYFDAVQLASESEVNAELAADPTLSKVAVIAARHQRNSINADVQTGQGSYSTKATLDYCPSALLSAGIDRMQTVLSIKDGTDLDLIELNEWLLLDDEKLAVTAIDLIANTVTVKRGVLGTVPALHAAEARLYFCDQWLAVDNTDYYAGEIVNAKVLTNTSSAQLSAALATAHLITLNGEAYRPYPPANVKINGEYYPAEIETDLVLTWVDRNRLQQTGGEILGWVDCGVQIEPNTQTHLTLTQFDENNVELATTNANVTGTTGYTMPISSMQADVRSIEITLKTVRDGYECINAIVHTVELSTFFSAPYDIVFTVRRT